MRASADFTRRTHRSAATDTDGVSAATTVADIARAPAPRAAAGRLWIMSELYFPEETSTGYVLTTLAEALAAYYPVSVLCGQPTYSARGTRAPAHEERRGVAITRCAGLTLNKDVLPLRFANMATLAMSILAHAIWNLRRNDLAVVVTNPPVLPFLIAAACRARGARCILLIHDVYPDAPVVAGLLQRGSAAALILARATDVLYRRVSHVCVIGRDMAALVRRRLGAAAQDRVTVIPNWAADEVLASRPAPINALRRELGLEDKFVVEYAGNLGKVHHIECLLEAASQLQRVDDDVHFLFIGSGAKRQWLVDEVRRRDLANVTILPPKPRRDEPVFLHACDVAVMALVSGMAGVGVPSRLYNILAAAKPVIASVDADSEPALVIREEEVGWVVPPGDAGAVIDAIRAARRDRARLAEMGRRAAAVARAKYTLTHAVDAYCALIDRVWRAGP